MLRGLYTSGVGMTTQMKKMDVVSNNIANVNTTGYKKDTVVTSSFDDELAKRTHDYNKKDFAPMAKRVGNITYGAYVDEVYTDFSAGSLKTTLGTYDLAISGSGFFAVGVADNRGNVTEKYTRDGSFTVDMQGYLVTTDGGRVQGQNGDIVVPDGLVVIEKNGEISVGDELIDTLKIVDFEDTKTLRKQADNYIVKTAGSVEKPFEGSIQQGMLEMSNVNTVKEMVDLIATNRAYEANQRIVLAIDSTLQRSVTEVGRK